MAFVEGFRQIYGAVQKVINDGDVKSKALDEARSLASSSVSQVLRSAGGESLPRLEGVEFGNEDERDEFLLVLEFLQQSNVKFGVPVLGFEAQHPELVVDRQGLAQRLGLDADDERPLLVQIVDMHMKSSSKKKRK